ncbi:hypothetical protein HID58_074460, partial [Brassica napus]
HPFPSVEPFGVPSRSMGELRGNKTFVAREVLQFLLVSFLFFHFGCIFSKSGDCGNILLRSGGSRIYPPETWRFVGLVPRNSEFVELILLEPEGFGDGTPCVLLFFQVKQQYFSVPGLGEYGLTWSHAALCFPLGEPLSAFSGRHSMTRRLVLNLRCHGHPRGLTLSAYAPAFLVFVVGEKYSGIEFLRPQAGHRPLDPRWKEPRFPGSQLEGTPVPCCGDRPPSSGKGKTSDKENLPYLRIWKSLTYSNRLKPALGRLYKGNPNPKAEDRHFKTWRLGLDG